MSLVKAEDITVRDGGSTLLAPLSLALEPGEPLVVLGETGSGRSLVAQALMGALPPELDARGHVAVGTRVSNAGDPSRFRGLWGREFGVLPQEPRLSLDPLMRAGAQVAGAHALVRSLPRRDAPARASADPDAFGLAGAVARYPHRFSGGMAQRAAIAAARAGSARIVIADEPTLPLDPIAQAKVIELLSRTAVHDNVALMLVSHEHALVRNTGDAVLSLDPASPPVGGEPVEATTAASFGGA